ncbi:hypothetical protein E0H75_23660 [Kribbella capetownensis]|uniref:PBP domain-containing protein n=1 Tax=Kribbella capetownensis TaxID=1572659 RepID=A0A4R0JRU9_9ACTN|nr:substrate-binding domain-containing protein [Kribbella capetownensis]TCC47748.1 hypothetical protein E0H75_23660 [Kribbella capetownensis]
MAVVVFAVVINRSAAVTSLTTAQLRAIYNGQITNWKDVGGKDLPIRMVSRVGPDSGSRRVFREKVLGGDQELGITSDDCRTDDDAAAAKYLQAVGDRVADRDLPGVRTLAAGPPDPRTQRPRALR